jgi:hypothetical protein
MMLPPLLPPLLLLLAAAAAAAAAAATAATNVHTTAWECSQALQIKRPVPVQQITLEGAPCSSSASLHSLSLSPPPHLLPPTHSTDPRTCLARFPPASGQTPPPLTPPLTSSLISPPPLPPPPRSILSRLSQSFSRRHVFPPNAHSRISRSIRLRRRCRRCRRPILR